MTEQNNVSLNPKAPEQGERLHRGLSNRHIQLIAIGGAIGTGLFMGSGRAISMAGPSVIFVYMLIGAVIFLVLRAMGEILLSNLRYKSFSDFTTDLVGPMAGFFLGWSYWFMWVVTAVADIIAIVGYLHMWWPDLQAWIPALAVIAVLLTLNLVSVKNFGEIEFWFSMIKIVAIVALIIVGGAMVAIGFTSPAGAQASVANLWNDGGMFPNHFIGFLGAFQIAVFAFMGSELVGTTAAETQDPEKTLPRAINAVPVRIMVFYVGALVTILMVTPWRLVSPDKSPFVAMFTLAGLGIAAHIINFERSAPQFLGKISKNGVPRNALFLSAVMLLSSIVLLYAGDSISRAFNLVTTVAAVLVIFAWAMIMVSYLMYRKKFPSRHKKSKFRLPGGRFSAWLSLVFFAFTIGVLAMDEETLRGLLAMPVWFAILGIGWFFKRRADARRHEAISTRTAQIAIVEASEIFSAR
ncbi:MAG: amino acid permease [Rothia mucilaginosa]|uniref:amino acid permease n=1 Tax=Rothia mucilaginosa TaxID=43675 RepID=UPI0026EC058D|nr:amino acid permease [Rothia mucilaginosa]MBS4941157.1 amino acid permease [Rothia mucilaginosa]